MGAPDFLSNERKTVRYRSVPAGISLPQIAGTDWESPESKESEDVKLNWESTMDLEMLGKFANNGKETHWESGASHISFFITSHSMSLGR